MVIRNLSDLPRALENLDRCYLQQAKSSFTLCFLPIILFASVARNNIIVTFTT